MTINIAINGLGRIGRLVFRLAYERADINIVAINDLVPPDNLAYLLKYDSIHGQFSPTVTSAPNALVVNGVTIPVYAEKDPSQCPWKKHEVDYVLESTGLFRTKELAQKHIEAGAKRVVLSAPAKDALPTFVVGVNHNNFDPATDTIVSNASCTTNCLAPIAKVIDDAFGIEEGLMTTIHAVTSSQKTVDAPCPSDFRRGRSASLNIIPSSTGAAKAVGLCLPQLKGKLSGMAMRVPVGDVSTVDLTVRTKQQTSLENINATLQEAAQNQLKGILDYVDQPLVSSDYIGNTFSSSYDSLASIQLSSNFFKLIAWYDNEAGYSARLIDLMSHMAAKEADKALV